MQQQGGAMMRNSPSYVSGATHSRNFDTIWSPLVKTGTSASSRSYAFFSLFLFLLLGAFLSTRLLLDPSVLIEKETVTVTQREATQSPKYPQSTKPVTEKPTKEFTLNCAAFSGNGTVSCPRNSYPTSFRSNAGEDESDRSPSATCPDYFRWIHEDLRPWEKTGITREALERANATAIFRLAIIDGRIYVENFREAFQTRDVFTIWGFVQLLRRYPGKIPDLELMFDCVDWPVVKAAEYSGVDQPSPPPLFRYCANNETLDIVFPDWSYWGWAEVNIKPWESLLKDLNEGNQRTKWIDREPYAYWKGNPTVAETRLDLMKCNLSEQYDWKARLYKQDWVKESKEGYKTSDLASQCHHRYKIYIEGSAWSVSEKYILACDSVTLMVKPHYYDFFTRGMFPGHHYWPVKEDDKCRSIKFAVDWGNLHMRKAQDIGRKASEFVQQELKMDYVYDYMFHLLTQYSKLLRFKPEIPQNSTELCSEAMACPRDGNERKFMMESLVKHPAETGPCTMPPPYDPASFYSVLKRRQSTTSRIEQWESKYWRKQNKTGS
ncbi:PREDICTED: protein O-glucosyltransferase 1-like isoform X2 [Camelina sativa]|uniref:Protein O-glucosyltransferase 1-like isoform X1 n=1 Tax=Camelina sativa TaxID=90675 RepID=A0ABM0YNA4_CAMSA|nr:PREDICTED: protein O-glucosyltransferase 1-like isoform X1 [Camelina sativa]XP_010503545.1 PREDICTED: protein O-glucosyltransferase 1-like isoform X2 [Camelina sativa]